MESATIGGIYVLALLLQEYAQRCARAEHRGAPDDWRTRRDRWILEALCRNATPLACVLPPFVVHHPRETRCASWRQA